MKRSFRELYKRIAESKWFRKSYRGKSLGDFIPVDNGSNNKNHIGTANKVKYIDWLKSLRPVSKESLQPHWKKSLATADLENSLCDLQDNYHDGSHEYKILGEAIEFIRCTELRPSWKPNKEQMKALNKTIIVCMGVVGRDEIAPLESLYEQLKSIQ